MTTQTQSHSPASKPKRKPYPFNRVGAIDALCHYVLSQDHERDAAMEEMAAMVSRHSKPEVMEYFEQGIYYRAMHLKYGRGEAKKQLNELYYQALSARLGMKKF